nr:unnamed protein product [Spirometra erinaceieuropaei]
MFEELFEEQPQPIPRKTRGELMKQVDISYYGNCDEDDGVILPQEAAYEEKCAATVEPQHPLPGSVACRGAGVKIAKGDQFIRLWSRRHERVQAFVEFIFLPHQSWSLERGMNTDDSDEFIFPKRRTQGHQSVVGGLRQTKQSSHDVFPDGKGDACLASLCFWAVAPGEGVTGTRLLWLAQFKEQGPV